MTLLIVGLLAWWVTHLFPIYAASSRDALAGRIGELPFKAVFALATVGAVVLMVVGYQAADPVNVWFPPAFLVHVNNILMLLAIAAFIAGGIPSPVRRWIRHPQLTGVKIWALAHLLVNGDLASLVLFGGLLAWAVVALIGSNRRDGPRGEKPATARAGTAIHILASIALYWVVGYVHGGLLGVWPFPTAS